MTNPSSIDRQGQTPFNFTPYTQATVETVSQQRKNDLKSKKVNGAINTERNVQHRIRLWASDLVSFVQMMP